MDGVISTRGKAATRRGFSGCVIVKFKMNLD